MSATSSLQVSITGQDPSQRLQQVLKEGEVVRLGRAPQQGWAIPWDPMISREHANVCWEGGKFRITVTENARNPIVYRGRTTKELFIAAGDWFQIGSTTFHIAAVEAVGQADSSSGGGIRSKVAVDLTTERTVMEERSYSPADLRKVKFGNTDRQMEILSELPEKISGSHSDADLGGMIAALLLQAIPTADAVAVAHFDSTLLPPDENSIDDFPEPLTMRVETRENFNEQFSPSRRMILRALTQDASVMHIWGDEAASEQFTMSEGLGWAFCCPVRGESCQGWCMYVSGKGTESGSLIIQEEDLAGDLRFTELVSQFIGSVRQVRLLQEQKTQLSTFFSPKVIENLTDARAQEMLEPAERDISVLFCDVRGFSRKSEALQDDLLQLLKSVSAALGVMAGGILERDGAIADFQGDAALGFWGWPTPLEDGPVPACRAALEIFSHFRNAVSQAGSLLEGFSVGIGVAHGRAVAGQVGTDKQAKVGVFGPVVNQGSRLEGMTKQFGVSICIDEVTADYAKRILPPDVGRVRRLATVRPKGMDTPLTVFGLLPPEAEFPDVTNQMIDDYDVAVTSVIDGNWDAAREALTRVPDGDGPKQFLLSHMDDAGGSPPSDWDGAFALKSK